MTPTALGTPSCCDNGEPSGSNATLHEPISADGTPVPGQVYAVPARHGRAVRLQRGQTLRIVNTHGTQVCDLWAFHAPDFGAFMSSCAPNSTASS